jgi:hypothetical protein
MTERSTIMFRGADAPDDCYDFYEMSRGYRKVAGNSCFGGVDLNPIQMKCPGRGISFKTFLVIIAIGLLIFAYRQNPESFEAV